METKFELDRGPFFHGTKAELQLGDLLVPQQPSNYQNQKSNHIYFTATLDAAKWGAELALGGAKERIYLVEPSGEYEDDPNVTNKRFAGNPTRSYRSKAPLKIIAELAVWVRHSDQEIERMVSFIKRLREEGQAVIED